MICSACWAQYILFATLNNPRVCFCTYRNVSISEDAWRHLVREELHQYEGELYDAFTHGISTDSTLHQWDFWGSFLFCATVYTTIGE